MLTSRIVFRRRCRTLFESKTREPSSNPLASVYHSRRRSRFLAHPTAPSVLSSYRDGLRVMGAPHFFGHLARRLGGLGPPSRIVLRISALHHRGDSGLPRIDRSKLGSTGSGFAPRIHFSLSGGREVSKQTTGASASLPGLTFRTSLAEGKARAVDRRSAGRNQTQTAVKAIWRRVRSFPLFRSHGGRRSGASR